MNVQNIILDDWQKEILDYDGNIVLCTGRQVGKTLTFSRKAVNYMLKHKGSQIIIVSLTEDQSKLIIMMMLQYLEQHHPKLIAKKKDKPTQNKITLTNKSTALARPVGLTGDSVRGFTGDVLIIDEASRMPELVWTSAKPTLLTTNGQIWMCSTPFGKQGYFYEAYLNKNNRYKVFHINSEDAIKNRPIKEGWTEQQKQEAIEFLKQEKKDMSELQYGQEYLGLFLEDLRQYFSDELIAKACRLERPKPPRPNENIFLGVDIARLGGDECAYEFIYRKEEAYFKHIENITKKEQLTTKTEEDILHFNKTYQPERIGIDAGSGSLGVGIFDRLMKNEETRHKVIAMNNRAISMDKDKKTYQRIFKEDMYDNLKAMMEKGELQLLDDSDVIASLKSVQWELKEVAAGTKIRIFGNYTHIVEGLIRAAWLAKKEKVNKLSISYI